MKEVCIENIRIEIVEPPPGIKNLRGLEIRKGWHLNRKFFCRMSEREIAVYDDNKLRPVRYYDVSYFD